MSEGAGSWFPMIFSEKCDGCVKAGRARCVEFCPNGVFNFEDGKAIVAFPAKCGGDRTTAHCSACAPLCHNKAIVFPQTNVPYTQVKDEDKGLIRKTTCKTCAKHYWTNREENICFDCEKKRTS